MRKAQRSSQRNGTSVVTEIKSRQAAKIRELGQSLIDAGFVKAQYRRLTEGVAKKREGFVGEGVIRLASRPRQPHVRTSFGTDVRDNVRRSRARSARTQKPEGLTQPPTPRASGPPRVPPTSRRSRSPSSRRLVLIHGYYELEKQEREQFRLIGEELDTSPIYAQWLKDQRGIGPAMAAVRPWPSFIWEHDLQMKRGLSFTLMARLGLLASVAMAIDNNWPGAALGCVASGCLFVMAIA